MLSVKQNFPLYVAFILPFVTAIPVLTRDDPFAKFVEFLMRNNCSMPKVVDIPFQITDSSPFSYLSTPLQECQSPEVLKENNEAHLLCKEVFDVLQNITCNDYSMLSKINSSGLSTNICSDFAAIQEILPEQKEYLSRRLGDGVLCKLLCTGKYELLCKTLLWSYDTQAKIRKALDSEIKENEKEGKNDIVTNKNDPNEKITEEQELSQENHEANEIPDKASAPDSEVTRKLLNESSLSSFENQSVSNTPLNDEALTNKSISSVSSSTGNKITNSSISEIIPNDNPNKANAQVDMLKDPQKSILNDNVQPSEQNLEQPDKNTHQEESVISIQSKNIINDPVKDVNRDSKVNSLNTKDENNQSEGSNTSDSLPVKGNNESNVKSSAIVKPSEKTLTMSETEVDNGMPNVALQEPSENEVKDEKGTDLKKKPENSKESFVSGGVTLETDSNLSSTAYSEKNEDLEHPEVKDPELYNDSENDGDYPKQEYDNGFSSSLKKETNIKNPVEDVSSHISSSSSIQISPENFPGRFDGSQNFLPARNYLPEQEDSHFFFYFLSIVLILMAGYLIFHNKQKIIALIVEGRHERRRRSHGAGYKKLETK